MASRIRCKPDGLAAAVMQCLDGYDDDVADATKESCMKVGKEGAQMLKGSSPVRKGGYARSWTYKVMGESASGIESVIYNSRYPGLAHLLENGHAKRGGGRVGARKHIAPVEQYVIETLETEIESRVGKI